MQTQAIISRKEYDNVVNRPDAPRTLPGRAYHDPKFFSAEVEHLFKKQWFPVGHEQMMPEVGDFYTIDLWDHPLVIVRGDDGELRVLDRRCLETGRDIFMHPFAQGHCEEILGNVLGHRSWVYNLRGERIDGDVADLAPGQALPSYALENWHGFLLVNLDGESAPYSPDLQTMEPWLENYRLDELKLLREPTIFDMDANWKLIAENYIEAYHHLGTHRNTFEKVSPARTTGTEELKDKVVFLRMPIKQDFSEALDWTLPPIETLQESDLVTFPVFLSLPLFLLAPLHNSVAWLHLIPVSAEKSYWMIYILAPEAYLQRSEDIRNLQHSGVEIHNEDMDACIGNQKGVQSQFFDQGFIHPTLEKGVWYFDRFILKTLIDSDPELLGE